jgi:hypothetical protein
MPPPGRDESSLPLLDTSFNQFTLSFSDEPTSDDDDTTPTATTRPNGASSSSYPPLRRPLPPSFHRSGSPERSRTSTGESIDTLLAPYSDDGGLVEVQELGRSRESSRSTSPLAGAGGRGIKSMIASRELGKSSFLCILSDSSSQEEGSSRAMQSSSSCFPSADLGVSCSIDSPVQSSTSTPTNCLPLLRYPLPARTEPFTPVNLPSSPPSSLASSPAVRPIPLLSPLDLEALIRSKQTYRTGLSRVGVC